MTPVTKPSNASVWSALSAVYLLWGGTYLGMAVVVEKMPPLLSAGTRFGSAGLILAIVLAIRRGPRSLLVSRRELAGAALIGLLLLGLANGSTSLAERYVPSSMAALVVATVPMWIVLFRLAFGQRPAAHTWWGVTIGFAGIAGLVAATGHQDPDPGTGYIDLPGWQVAVWLGVVLFASVSWAFGSTIAPLLRKADRSPSDPLTSTVWQFLAAATALLTVGLLRGENPAQFADATTATWTAWAFLVLGGLVAYSCYIWLLSHAPVSLVSTYAYVNPLVAVFLGWLILSEPLTPALAAAAVLVLTGVLLVVRGERGSAISVKESEG